MKVVYKSAYCTEHYICEAQFHRLAKGNNICIQLTAIDDPNQSDDVFPGELIATATVNTEGIPTDHVAVKDYSENRGVLDALINANIVYSPVTYREQGFVKIPICKLTPEALAVIAEI